MTIIVLVVLGAMAIGRIRGGSPKRLAMLRLPRTGLVIGAGLLAIAGQYGGRFGLPSRPTYVVCTVLSALLVGVFVYANRHVVGVPVIAIGFLLNALVIVANGAMPVSQRAADFAGVETGAIADSSDAKHELVTSDTVLLPLADVIPLRLSGPMSWAANVYSFGDIVLAAGIGLLVLGAMERPGAGRQARQVSRGKIDAVGGPPREIDLRDPAPASDPSADAPAAEFRVPSSFPAPW